MEQLIFPDPVFRNCFHNTFSDIVIDDEILNRINIEFSSYLRSELNDDRLEDILLRTGNESMIRTDDTVAADRFDSETVWHFLQFVEKQNFGKVT